VEPCDEHPLETIVATRREAPNMITSENLAVESCDAETAEVKKLSLQTGLVLVQRTHEVRSHCDICNIYTVGGMQFKELDMITYMYI
jgi:hypothetical protein